MAAQGVEYRPVVLMHGISTVADKMEPLRKWIEAAFPGTAHPPSQARGISVSDMCPSRDMPPVWGKTDRRDICEKR